MLGAEPDLGPVDRLAVSASRSKIADMTTVSLTRLCDLVAEKTGSPAEPERAGAVAAATS
jgi:hypothetical protein